MNKAIALWLLASAFAEAQTVTVDAGGIETILPGGRVTLLQGHVVVKSGGALKLSGASSNSVATLAAAAPCVKVEVRSGGLAQSTFGRFESIDVVEIKSGAKLARLHDTTFADAPGYLSPAKAWLDLCDLAAADRANLPFSFHRLVFSVAQVSTPRKNVAAGLNTPLVRVLGASGNRAGEGFDTDPFDRVLWHTGAVTRSTPTGTFDTIDAALADAATTSSSTISVTLGPLAFLDQNIDWNLVPSASAAGPTLINANLAPLLGDPVSDSDSGDDKRGFLVNAVVARGALSETSMDNCTIFDPNAGVTLNWVTGRNLLIKSGYSGSNNTFDSNTVTSAVAGWFLNAPGYDFHLIAAAGPAINSGQTLPYAYDFEGDARPLGTAWDVGADEYGSTYFVTNSLKTQDTTPSLTVGGVDGTLIGLFRLVGGTWVLQSQGTISGGSVTLTDPSSLGDGIYSYRYGVGNGSGWVLGSAVVQITVDNAAPMPPTNVRAAAFSGSVLVEWNTSISTDVAGYRVFRAPASDPTNFVQLHPTGTLVVGLRYRDDTAVNGTAYKYMVRAVDDALPE